QEYEARLKSGIFPPRENPLITQENWDKLKEYIISTAPDSLVLDHNTLSEIKDLHQFKTKPVRLNPHRKSALMTVYLEHFKENNEIVMGTVQGHLLSHSFDTDESKPLYKSESGITSYFNIKGDRKSTRLN